jgi:hypothetical protein
MSNQEICKQCNKGFHPILVRKGLCENCRNGKSWISEMIECSKCKVDCLKQLMDDNSGICYICRNGTLPKQNYEGDGEYFIQNGSKYHIRYGRKQWVERKELEHGHSFLNSAYQQHCTSCGYITNATSVQTGQCRNCFFCELNGDPMPPHFSKILP